MEMQILHCLQTHKVPWSLLLILSSICSCFFVADGTNYGPSIIALSSSTDLGLLRRFISSGFDSRVLSPIWQQHTGKRVSLDRYPNFAVRLNLSDGSSAARLRHLTKPHFYSDDTAFSVEAPETYGIMAVIQEMDFRTQYGNCKDYIQFSDGYEKTDRICGQIGRNEIRSNPDKLIGTRYFASHTGKLNVTVGNIWPEYQLGPVRPEPILRLSIAFTAYKDDCPHNTTDANGKHVFTTFRPCEVNKNGPGPSPCIKKPLFCDSTLNCGYDLGFSQDESHCPEQVQIVPLLQPVNKPEGKSLSPVSSATSYSSSSTPVPTGVNNQVPSANSTNFDFDNPYWLYSKFSSAVFGTVAFLALLFTVFIIVFVVIRRVMNKRKLVQRTRDTVSTTTEFGDINNNNSYNLHLESVMTASGAAPTRATVRPQSSSSSTYPEEYSQQLESFEGTSMDKPPSYAELFSGKEKESKH